MKTTNKKLAGGLLVGILIATIGVAFAAGQTESTNEDAFLQIPFGGIHGMNGIGPFAYDLTEEQQTELEELMTNLKDQNATSEEIKTEIQEKLDEYGVLDTQLDNEIAKTEQRLTILNRQKELRYEGYSWDEIINLIEDEFGLENTTGIGWDTMEKQRFEHGPCGDLQGVIPSEESDQ